MVWGRQTDLKRTDAAARPAAKAETSSNAGSMPDAATPSEAQLTPISVVEPAAPAVAETPASSAVPTATAASVTPAAPMSRRSRRVQTAEQPVVAVPPVASAEPARGTAALEAEPSPRHEPAPLQDSVTAPAESFQLLAPAADEGSPRTSAARRPDEPAPRAEEPASPAASTWMTETFAKLLAAEAAEAPASTAPVVETAAPQTTASETKPASETTVAPRVSEPVRTARTEVVAESRPTVTPEVKIAPQPTAPVRPVAEPAVSTSTVSEPTRMREERPRTERIEPLTGPIPKPAASGVDEFEAAARLFAFTGETPVQRAATPKAEPEAEPVPAQHKAPRRPSTRSGSAFKRVATASFSVGVFGIVGLMAVGMTTPAEAVAAVSGDEPLSVIAPADSKVPVIDEAEIQAYVAPGDVQSDPLDRNENYATVTTAELASEAGIRNFSNLFHNNPNSNIQWPFSVGVTMSYGFGMRSGRMHEGIDFTPGNGAPVQAVADGTVRVASEAGGAYGVHVIIDHIIDGQLVSSHYAHMQYGSLQVRPGQHVTVGTVIGHTGNTGRSYGAHTHFEILKNGTTAIDPWPWLQEYTDGTHTVG